METSEQHISVNLKMADMAKIVELMKKKKSLEKIKKLLPSLDSTEVEKFFNSMPKGRQIEIVSFERHN